MEEAGLAVSASTLNLLLEVVVRPESLRELQPDYERLCTVTGNTLPFALFEWHDTWCRHFLRIHRHIQETLLFYVVRDPYGTCVGIFPFVHSQRHLGPLKLGSVDLLGADPALTEVRSPLIEPGHERQSLRLVRKALAQSAGWDWVQWGTTDRELLLALNESGIVAQQITPDYVIDLKPTWEEFRAGLKRNIRESLRHCYNSLRREGLPFELMVTQDPDEVRPALDRFLRLHRLRANMPGAPAHPDRFSSAVSARFLYEVCERLARRGVFRLLQLRINDQIVAARIGFVVGDSLYLYYSGFDPTWAKFGVMTTTVAESIKYAIALGLKTVNLSPTMDLSKTRWGPRVIDHYTGYERHDRLTSHLANDIYRHLREGNGIPARLLLRAVRARRNWD
jgi:CelD/BcsL family acetyltransferase involved in cellulose biosynthesis